MTDAVGSKLLDEIERVLAKRARWIEYAKISGSEKNFAPAIYLMELEIQQAKEVLQSDDPAAAIRALKALEEYGDDD